MIRLGVLPRVLSFKPKKMKSSFFTFFLLFFVSSFYAQTGIRGSVYDKSNGEVIPRAKIFIASISKGAYTDFDGKFEIPLEKGTYTLAISCATFESIEITDVVVKENEITILDDVGLSVPTKDKSLGTVRLSATQRRDTETAILSLKAKSPNLIDGISSASFRKTGDSDAASAMKRVPGISLSGGKYIFVRGIGDRYNKTMLNGVDIPGLDPDKNTIQMDLFPTSVIENIVVNKSFVADLPADFTGGVINIELKGFPDEKSTSISGNLGYNPNFHLNANYLTYKGGKLDFLGIDDGTRSIPATAYIPLFAQVVGNPNGTLAERYKEILGAFNPNLSAYQTMSLMDAGFSISHGNQKKLKKNTIGYNFLFNYKNSTEFYSDIEYGRYGLSGNSAVNEMEARVIQKGQLGVNNVLMSAMAGFSIKNMNSKYVFNLLHLQNGESSAGIFEYTSRDQGADFDAFQHNLTYSQRSLTNLYIGSKTRKGESDWSFEWNVAPTVSTIIDPDFRITRYQVRDAGELAISTETGFPERIWRNLLEFNVGANAFAEKKYRAFGESALLKFGFSNTFKAREYIIRNFTLNIRGDLPLTGDPNELFSEEFLWPYNGNVAMGTTFEAPFIPTNPNQYSSNLNNSAVFVSNQMSIGKKLKTVIGLRSEYYVHRYTGQDQQGTNVLNNEKVLENLGLYPSLNLVYAVSKTQNVRASYGKTIARPSFKELSYAEIYDPVTGRTFIGGLFKDSAGPDKVYWTGNLVSTTIHNFDLRWELFPGPGRTVSISGFYKKFLNPIEIIQYAVQDGSFQPRNVGDGEVFGTEIEIRENLAVLWTKLKSFEFILNTTIVDSRIQLNQIEYESRVQNARDGQEISPYRKMAGQSPYVVNGGFNFKGQKESKFKTLEAGVFYNVQGRTLQYVGIVDRPDIYSVPFHSLNFNVQKRFGKEENMLLSLKVSNLLNDKKEAMFESFGAENQYFERITPGTSFVVKFNYNF